MTPRPYQTEIVEQVLRRYADGKNRVVVQKPTGCHAKGQGILMYNGLVKRVEDVVVGDQLMGPDSKPRNVLGLSRGRDIMYRVVPKKGPSFVVNQDHILTLVRTEDGTRYAGDWIDISVSDYLEKSQGFKHVHKLARVPVRQFDGAVSELPIEPYFMGVLLGDGSLTQGQVSLCKPDDEILVECERQAGLWGMRLSVSDPDNRARSYKLCRVKGTEQRNPMARVLEDLELLYLGSGEKFIPQVYKTTSVKNRFHLLAGILDTDGHLTDDGCCYDFISKSRQFAEDVVFLVRSLGMFAQMKPSEKYCQTGSGGIYWRVYISGDTDSIPCRIARKKASAREQKKDSRRTGFKLERLEEDDYYGFTLDGNGRFLLDDFTVTHNTGKTVTASLFPDAMNFTDKDWMLFLVHRDELAQQADDKLRKWNPTRTVGIEMASSRAGSAQLVVGSVQTLGRTDMSRMEQLVSQHGGRPPKLIITDECHRSVAPTYKKIYNYLDVENNTDILHVGITATVNRADGRGLNEVYQEISYQMRPLDAIRQGWLVDPVGKALRTGLDLSGVGTRGGDFIEEDLAKKINTPAHNDQVIRFWLAQAERLKTAGFGVNVDHCQKLAEAARSYGVSAEAVWGDDPLRADKLKMHRAGALRLLFSCQLLIEGYDDPSIECILLVRPTQSSGLYQQIIGRGLRLPEGTNNLAEAKRGGKMLSKENCLVLDTVYVTQKHSLVTLPSLFGLNPNMDMKGRSILDVMEEVEEIKEAKPWVDISVVTDASQITSYAEQVDLFRTSTPPEVIQISEFLWRRGTDGYTYVLLLKNNQHVVVTQDLIGKWHVVGQVNEIIIRSEHPDFETAIREADRQVNMWGGRKAVSTYKRKASWHDEPVAEFQRILCGDLGIPVLPGDTKGTVHLKIEEAKGRDRIKRLRSA